MSPRPFSEDMQFFHHNGSMVVQDGLVGFLSEVRRTVLRSIRCPSNRTGETRHVVCNAVETYQQLYNYEQNT